MINKNAGFNVFYVEKNKNGKYKICQDGGSMFVHGYINFKLKNK